MGVKWRQHRDMSHDMSHRMNFYSTTLFFHTTYIQTIWDGDIPIMEILYNMRTLYGLLLSHGGPQVIIKLMVGYQSGESVF